ncbi:MAG: N-acetylmuramic acid 6-phosphate etherase [Planctomycetota bacterium]
MSAPLPPDRGHVPTERAHARAAEAEAAGTLGFLRFMNEEDRAVSTAVERATPSIASLVDAALPGFGSGGRLIYVGAGTSGRLGVLDASECPPTFLVEPTRVLGIIAGGDSALRRSSESLEDEVTGAHRELADLSLTPNDTLLAVTAGGTTPYALGAIPFAAAIGATTGLLTCGLVPDDPHPDHVIHLDTGPEVIRGSTRLKAGTATKLALNMISTTLMVGIGKTHKGLMVDVSASNDKLRDRAARTISDLTGLPRTEAFSLLERAGGRVKTAVVMHIKSCDRPTAEARLEAAGGRLGDAL